MKRSHLPGAKARHLMPDLMSSLALGSLLLCASALHTVPAHAADANPKALRVCADPDYMPFSNRQGQGFENKIAELMAQSMGRKLEYRWASYRGHGGFSEFLALNLDAGKCDVSMDLPYGDVEEDYTQPYYVSSYVFVTKKKNRYDIHSMRAPALKTMKIGFESDTPPVIGLKILGLIDNAVPFDVGGDPNASPKDMLEAVQSGKVGVLISWQPAIGHFLAGYPDLQTARVPNEQEGPGLPALRFSFAMAMGVRKNDTALKDALDRTIKAQKLQIDTILARYRVMPPGNGRDAGESTY